MKTRRTLLTTVFSAVLTLAGATAHAAVVIPPGVCLPGLAAAIAAHPAEYMLVSMALAPKVATLKTQLKAVIGPPSYLILLTTSRALASSIPPAAHGRVVVTLPDGTVVLDTGKTDDLTNADPMHLHNSYKHFQDKLVNENHNSRVAIFSAQQWPCGFAVESKLSSTTGVREDGVAYRLGTHLDSTGTARMTTHP